MLGSRSKHGNVPDPSIHLVPFHCFSTIQSLLSRNLLDAFLCSVRFLDQYLVRHTKMFEGSTTTSMARSAPALRASPTPYRLSVENAAIFSHKIPFRTRASNVYIIRATIPGDFLIGSMMTNQHAEYMFVHLLLCFERIGKEFLVRCTSIARINSFNNHHNSHFLRLLVKGFRGAVDRRSIVESLVSSDKRKGGIPA
ncbi:hypothetical protein DT065_17410 [Salicibibacter kimchii]|uniref:Uncharacterized protein n=1 Tax=Salicibibacter kimchii TaxID=2099786 RepID=A0A345C308_9BACI|nr:hypothetical protein DT065_17410 [Salicibibacter kimchii]